MPAPEHPDTATAPLPGLYRPGWPFTAAELHALCADGVLQRVLADVFAETLLPRGPSLRAAAAASLLNPTLRRHAVLAGETAAWVHTGGRGPEQTTVITQGVFRRATGSRAQWQIHQSALNAHEHTTVAGVQFAITTRLRTAEDLFMGVGVLESRRRVDELVRENQSYRAAHHLRQRLDMIHRLIGTAAQRQLLTDSLLQRLKYSSRIRTTTIEITDALSWEHHL